MEDYFRLVYCIQIVTMNNAALPLSLSWWICQRVWEELVLACTSLTFTGLTSFGLCPLVDPLARPSVGPCSLVRLLSMHNRYLGLTLLSKHEAPLIHNLFRFRLILWLIQEFNVTVHILITWQTDKPVAMPESNSSPAGSASTQAYSL